MKSKVLAISAISASLVAICLTVGAYIEMTDLFTLIISSVFIILPLYYKSYKGSILCATAGGVIAFLFSGFNIFSLVFPSFFLFFGIYPILSQYLREKKTNRIIYYLIGAIWCIAVFYGAFFYYTKVMNIALDDFPQWLSWLSDNILWFIAPFGAIFYFVYDRFIVVMKRFIDFYLHRIIK